MTQDTSAVSHSTVNDSPAPRRSLLATVAAGAAVGLAGCAGRADPADSSTPTPMPQPSGVDAIDPQFGFVGHSPDAEPPVEPDHEVQLLIGEREGGPVPEFYFDPVSLYVEAGDVVKFVMATPTTR